MRDDASGSIVRARLEPIAFLQREQSANLAQRSRGSLVRRLLLLLHARRPRASSTASRTRLAIGLAFRAFLHGKLVLRPRRPIAASFLPFSVPIRVRKVLAPRLPRGIELRRAPRRILGIMWNGFVGMASLVRPFVVFSHG
jgi:hypothetical protein